VRVDSGVTAGSEISPMYDPMIAKLIVWDVDREQATRRMLRALHEYRIEGLKTLLPFHRTLLQTKQWANGETARDLIEDRAWLKSIAAEPAATPVSPADVAEEGDEPKVAHDYTVEVSGRRFDVKVIGPPFSPVQAANGAIAAPAARKPARRERGGGGAGGGAGGGDALASPMQGTVLKIAVEPGAQVEQGALIAIIEAMKMENEITAHKAGTVTDLPISVGASVASGDTLAVIKSEG
jgi:acetyl-CoA/propionyl-CoA carboxylase biotin carboxyl carrier protein